MIREGQQVRIRRGNAARALGVSGAIGFVIELSEPAPEPTRGGPTARAETAVVFVGSRRLLLRIEMLEAV